MKTHWYIIYSLFFLFVLISCEKDENIDTEKPQILNDFSDAFPTHCDTLYFGESFDLRLLLTDNMELGSFSIGIHNNFDHHSHSTEVTECSLGPVKEPVNPLVFIDDYPIPDELKEYETNRMVSIPAENDSGLFDEGDYHFFIRLTDNEGWSAQKGLSIKMLYR